MKYSPGTNLGNTAITSLRLEFKSLYQADGYYCIKDKSLNFFPRVDMCNEDILDIFLIFSHFLETVFSSAFFMFDTYR